LKKEEKQILIGFIPSVNFNNILHEAFTCKDPKSAKNTVKLSFFFAHLGLAVLKAELKMLVKSTPGLTWTGDSAVCILPDSLV